MEEPVNYGVFRELFKVLGINPKDFWELSRERVSGYFPDLPHRETNVDVEELARVIWAEGDNYGEK